MTEPTPGFGGFPTYEDVVRDGPVRYRQAMQAVYRCGWADREAAMRRDNEQHLGDMQDAGVDV